MAVKLNEDDDFGFSLVSESELKSIEETLSKQIADKEAEARKAADAAAVAAAKLKQTASQVSELQLTQAQMQEKLEGLVKMFNPLLNNLMQGPDKEYIYWPDRVEKIKKFKQKIENYIKQ